MATLTITKNWADASVLNEADLDKIKTDTETFVNTTKLNDDNFQTGGITASSKIAAQSITGVKLNADVVDNSTVELASNVIQVKDLGITTAKIADSAVTTAKIADANITTAKIADNAISTASIADSTITKAKLSGSFKNTSLSSSSSTFATSSTTYVDVTNLSVSFTVTAGFVAVSIVSDGSNVMNISSTTGDGFRIRILRDSTVIHELSSLSDAALSPKAGGLTIIDSPGVGGPYTYKVQAKANPGETMSAQYAKLRITELI